MTASASASSPAIAACRCRFWATGDPRGRRCSSAKTCGLEVETAVAPDERVQLVMQACRCVVTLVFVAEMAGRAQSKPWYLRAGRAAGAGLTGAAVGAGVAGIWHAGWQASGKACPEPTNSDALCFPVVPFAGAVLGSALVICAGVFLVSRTPVSTTENP